MLERYTHFILRHRLGVVIAAIALVIAAASGARLLDFTTDYRVFFSKENPQLAAFERLQNTYTKNDNVLFVLVPKDGKVFTNETLAAIEWLTKESWQIPYSIRVDSVTNFQHTRGQGDDLIVRDLVQGAERLTPPELARVREVALKEPLLLRRLVSPAADVAGVNVIVELPAENQHTAVPEVVAKARALAAQLRADRPDIAVHLSGIVLMDNAFSEAAQHDMSTLVPLMFAVIVTTLLVLLRSLWGTVVSVSVIVLSVAAAMGLAGWIGITLTPPSINAPTIIITLAVADCVHLLITYFHYLGEGRDRPAAMAESLKVNFYAVFLTSFTTAVGFLGMNFSEAPPFRDLGNIIALGVGAAWVLSVTFLPAVMTWLPARARHESRRAETVMTAIADLVVRRRRALLVGTGLVTAILALGITRNELNDEFVKYFDESTAFRRATDLAAERLNGPYTLDYSLDSRDPGGVSDPAFLRKVAAFADWYRAQPETLHVNTITDTFKRLNQNLHGDDPAWYRIPDSRELAAQYLLLYEMSLPYGLDLNNQLNVAKSATRFTVSLRNMSSNELIAMEARAGEWLAANFPEVGDVQGASPALMFSHIGRRNIESMLTGNVAALIVISLSLVLVFRTVKIGLLSMIPNLVPVAMAFGVWGLLVGRVGLGLSVVTSMTLGIVVDDTIHFLSKYLHARRDLGRPPEAAIRYAFSTVGVALWVLSVVLIAGFLVLAFSTFKLNAEMGVMTAGTFALGIFVEFLLVPPLLLWVERHAREPAGGPVSVTAPAHAVERD
jgi:predicted RND superfamily exporter protein